MDVVKEEPVAAGDVAVDVASSDDAAAAVAGDAAGVAEAAAGAVEGDGAAGGSDASVSDDSEAGKADEKEEEAVELREEVAAFKALLSERVRVKTNDGRVFIGSLECFDCDGNVVLNGVDEWRPASADAARAIAAVIDGADDEATVEAAVEARRAVGSALIQAGHIEQVMVDLDSAAEAKWTDSWARAEAASPSAATDGEGGSAS